MPTFRKLLLAIALLVIALPATAARRSVLMEDLRNQPVVTGSGKAPSVEQVRQAVLAGIVDAGWEIRPGTGEDHVVAKLLVRGKHTAYVDVTWTTAAFSVTYKDSENLNYSDEAARPVIHPNYNVWTRQLADAIRKRVLEL